METQNPEMEELHPAGAVQSEAAALAAVGAMLREARERGGMSIGDVASRLKFAPRQIEALEEGDIAHLPERTFIRGFVRSYARLVQLDEGPLLAALPGTPPKAPAPEARRAAERETTGQQPPLFSALMANRANLLWVGAALLLALIIILIWPSGGPQPQPRSEANIPGVPPPAPAASEAPAAPAAVPAPAPAPAPTPAPVPVPLAHEPESRHAVPPAPAPVKKPRKPVEVVPAPAASGVAAPAEAASGVSAVQPRTQSVLRLVCDEDSWTEVKDESGAVLLSQLCSAGSEQRVTSALPVSVVIGNAKGVKVYYRGRQIDLAPHTHADAARLKLR